MKLRDKLLVAGLAVWTVLWATSAGAGPRVGKSGGEPVNLLTNGGFEEGRVGWQPAAGHELATEAGAARTGKACLTGEVTKPKQALTLRRACVD